MLTTNSVAKKTKIHCKTIAEKNILDMDGQWKMTQAEANNYFENVEQKIPEAFLM